MKRMIKTAQTAELERMHRDADAQSAIDVMHANDDYQDSPEVGMFWYDPNTNELFGVRSSLADSVGWYHSTQWGRDVKTDTHLHKNIWQKEFHRGKDKRFRGDHTLVPRGRVFEFKDDGYRVYTGDWIDEYPDAQQLILDEFNLPSNTKFIKDVHWDIGHGWSDEF